MPVMAGVLLARLLCRDMVDRGVSDTASGKGAFIGSYARHARNARPFPLMAKGEWCGRPERIWLLFAPRITRRGQWGEDVSVPTAPPVD